MKKTNFFWMILIFTSISLKVSAQTCNTNFNKTNPDEQYTVSQDGSEVIDNKTGLIWQRCSVGSSWNGSICSGSPNSLDFNTAFSTPPAGWRLPNIKELFSLVEGACANSSINESLFPNTFSGTYWTSSIDLTGIYFIDFNNGTMAASLDNVSRRLRYVKSE